MRVAVGQRLNGLLLSLFHADRSRAVQDPSVHKGNLGYHVPTMRSVRRTPPRRNDSVGMERIRYSESVHQTELIESQRRYRYGACPNTNRPTGAFRQMNNNASGESASADERGKIAPTETQARRAVAYYYWAVKKTLLILDLLLHNRLSVRWQLHRQRKEHPSAWNNSC